jgi:hypothetical protein
MPILILLNFQWQNYSKLNNSCARIGLYIAIPTLVHTFIESFPTTQTSVVGDDCHGLGDLHVTNQKQNKTNKQPSSIDEYKL